MGQWGYPDQPRPEGVGADYQERISGKPWGIEINVGGTPTTTADGTPTAVGGKWFDDVRVDANGHVTLVDGKAWGNYVLPDQPWWVDRVAQSARDEVDVLRSAGLEGRATIEWSVSTDHAAQQIRQVLGDRLRPDERELIRIVVKP